MVVDAHGRAYVGNFGFDYDGGGRPEPTCMLCVEPDGEAWVVIENLLFPNGCIITPDNSTLIVAESFGRRLSAYDIADDGSLRSPRVWADVSPNIPGGVTADASGAVWVTDPVNNGVMRVLEGSGTVEWVDTEHGAYGCALGGSDGRVLYVCTAESSNPGRTVEQRSGRIEALVVDIPAPGFTD
jgi:sugar lactone lactonase YvrE